MKNLIKCLHIHVFCKITYHTCRDMSVDNIVHSSNSSLQKNTQKNNKSVLINDSILFQKIEVVSTIPPFSKFPFLKMLCAIED